MHSEITGFNLEDVFSNMQISKCGHILLFAVRLWWQNTLIKVIFSMKVYTLSPLFSAKCEPDRRMKTDMGAQNVNI